MTTEIQNTYTYYPVFRRTNRWMALSHGEKTRVQQEVATVLADHGDKVQVRGIYSTAGFRPDADIIMWWIASSPEDIQDLATALRGTIFGRTLDLSWAFLGLHRPAEFSRDHLPAFLQGEPARKYICVYPFVRTPEWYLLPPEQRGEMLRDHGGMGREFPMVQANTTQAFGISDYEWVLCFETDEFHQFVGLVRHLRAAEARRYTKLETPFIVGINKELPAVIADLA